MRTNKKIVAGLFIFTALVFIAVKVKAQEANNSTAPKVDYQGQVTVDSDLDGLTDKGEEQIYHTDPSKPDTDSDGYLDGAEVLAGTNPLDANDYPGHRAANLANQRVTVDTSTPWAWYTTRAAGLIGFVFLWLTIFLGLAIRNPLLKKIIQPIYSFDFHCFLGALAVFLALVHGTALLFDPSISFGIKDIAIPFYAGNDVVNTNYLALGIIAFYAMVIMLLTSYLRAHISHWLWRVLHFLNPLVFILIVLHGYRIGTDMQNIYVKSLFLGSAYLLAFIYLLSLILVLWNRFRAPSAEEILRKD